MTSRIRFVACLIGVAAFLWVSFSFVVALPLPHEAETGTVLRSALRLNLLMAGGILAICLLGLRVLEKNFHRGAFAHSAGTAAFLGVSIAVAAQVDSNSLLVSVLKGVGIALALVVASVAIARLVPMKRSRSWTDRRGGVVTLDSTARIGVDAPIQSRLFLRSRLATMMNRPAVLAALLLAATPQMGWSQTLLTSGANVRLRSAPAVTSSVVQMLPLGTELELTDSVRHGAWLSVRTGTGDRGWIDESLVISSSEATYREVVQGLIVGRLDRSGDGFLARAELVALIEKVLRLKWDIEDQARLELQRLQALHSTLRTIPFNRTRWDANLTAWITARADEVRYNEPAGEWLIERETILRAHTEVGTATVADEIAWFMVRNGLPGECEGVLVCYLEGTDKLEGEYLRRVPSGRHVEEAASQIEHVVRYYTEGLPLPSDTFDPTQECEALNTVVHSLAEALGGSSATDSASLVRQLRDMLTLCK